MLAQVADNVDEAFKAHGGETAFEYKYDGARIQIHKRNGEVKVFSRRLTDVTESLPEIVETVKRQHHSKRSNRGRRSHRGRFSGVSDSVSAFDAQVQTSPRNRRLSRKNSAETVPV